MSNENQDQKNGGPSSADAQQNALPFKEGELVLFVRMIKETSEFQCLFPDLFTALALCKLASEYLDQQVRQMFQTQSQIQIPPGLDLASVQRMLRRQKS